MALTDQEHQRFQTLQDEMLTLVETTDSDQAASAYSRIVRVCKHVLAREAETRTNKEVGTRLKTSRQTREQRRNGSNGRSPAASGTASGTA